MQCKKCNYTEKSQTKIFGSYLCKICATFAPSNPKDFQNYINERIDWKILDTFRIHGHTPGTKQKQGMQKMAQIGRLQTRPPLGYDVINGNLTPNEDAVRVHSLYKTFLARNYSLNSLAKNFSLSINGLKKNPNQPNLPRRNKIRQQNPQRRPPTNNQSRNILRSPKKT